jgi:hypothetical protein
VLHSAVEVVVSALLLSERYAGLVAEASLSNGDEKKQENVE